MKTRIKIGPNKEQIHFYDCINNKDLKEAIKNIVIYHQGELAQLDVVNITEPKHDYLIEWKHDHGGAELHGGTDFKLESEINGYIDDMEQHWSTGAISSYYIYKMDENYDYRETDACEIYKNQRESRGEDNEETTH